MERYLILVLLLSGCVSTAPVNPCLKYLPAGEKPENAFLSPHPEKYKEWNDCRMKEMGWVPLQ